ncbi:NgoPII family restriction endonuclease, partial [Candidatus Woesearchaeota archaeon]|nr:NgoPII family restriction endonuclease [Candidatus Woesearchaeota archaeon]
MKDPNKKMEIFLKEFSYFGSQNHPPDIIIKGGDAIEVKKVKGLGGTSIALNSSYPKSKLNSSNAMLTEECRSCENWSVKDIIYAVGNVFLNKVKIITFVYGDCYAAKPEVYEKIKQPVIDGINKLGLSLSKTTELARLNKIDPLKITDLRVRGMFQIASPIKFFSKIIPIDLRNNLDVFAIMRKSKFDSFNKKDVKEASSLMKFSDIK